MKIMSLDMDCAHNVRMIFTVDDTLNRDVIGYIISTLLHPSYFGFHTSAGQLIYTIEFCGSTSPMEVFNMCDIIRNLESGIHTYDCYSLGEYEDALKGFMDD